MQKTIKVSKFDGGRTAGVLAFIVILGLLAFVFIPSLREANKVALCDFTHPYYVKFATSCFS